MTGDDYIIKCKQQGMDDSIIAGKLGKKVEYVRERWRRIQALAQSTTTNGYIPFNQQWMTFCSLFENLGKQYMTVGEGLSNLVSYDELEDLLLEAGKQKDPVSFLMHNLIILKKYVPPPNEVEKLQQN